MRNRLLTFYSVELEPFRNTLLRDLVTEILFLDISPKRIQNTHHQTGHMKSLKKKPLTLARVVLIFAALLSRVAEGLAR